MNHALALMRRREPDPGPAALLYFSMIAAAGFVVGWATQLLGGF